MKKVRSIHVNIFKLHELLYKVQIFVIDTNNNINEDEQEQFDVTSIS